LGNFLLVPHIKTGKIGTFAFKANNPAPSLGGKNSVFFALVPSGKIHKALLFFNNFKAVKIAFLSPYPLLTGKAFPQCFIKIPKKPLNEKYNSFF